MTKKKIVFRMKKKDVEDFNNGGVIPVHDCVSISFSISKDITKIHSYKINNKKNSCFNLSEADKEGINSRVEYLFYDGKEHVYIENNTGVDLI